MARPQSSAKAGFYPTPPQALRQIAALLAPRVTYGTTPETDVYRMIDPCCGEGDALATVAEALSKPGLPPVSTYGVELSQERAKSAAQKLQNVMQADLFYTSIANDRFSLLFLNPPYDAQDDQETTNRIRSEFAFLQRCTQYLSKRSGVLVLIVQKKFLTDRTVRFLATQYHSLACILFPEEERAQFDQITIIGYRKTEPFADQKGEDYLTSWLRNPQAKPVNEDTYNIPALFRGEVHFSNTYHDPWHIALEAAASGIWETAEFKDMLNPPETARTRPLVPLRQGHIALLTAAGFLDDRELTDDSGTRVLVKGNIEKQTVTTQDDSDKFIQQERLKITITALNLETGEFHHIQP